MQTAESSSRKLNNQSEGIPLKISEPWLTSPWHVSNLPSETKRVSRCVANEGLSQRHIAIVDRISSDPVQKRNSHTTEAIRKLFHVENFNGEAFSLKEIVIFKESIGF